MKNHITTIEKINNIVQNNVSTPYFKDKTKEFNLCLYVEHIERALILEKIPVRYKIASFTPLNLVPYLDYDRYNLWEKDETRWKAFIKFYKRQMKRIYKDASY